MDEFVSTKIFNRRVVDLLPFVLANALDVNVEIVQLNPSRSYYIFMAPALNQTDRYVSIVRSVDPVEHYDALVSCPVQHAKSHDQASIPVDPPGLRRSSRRATQISNPPALPYRSLPPGQT